MITIMLTASQAFDLLSLVEMQGEDFDPTGEIEQALLDALYWHRRRTRGNLHQ